MAANTRKLCLTALGIALFVALTLCLQVPVFENYYLCLGYVVMAVYLWSFGTASGTAVGCLGVVLYCLVISGLRGMPGWAMGNLVIGLLLGPAFRFAGRMRKSWRRTAFLTAAVIVSAALGILAVKSAVESLLYAQPFLLRAGKNSYAFVADAAVLLVSLPVCTALEKPVGRLFPALSVRDPARTGQSPAGVTGR